jgi:cytochrome P450
VSLDDRPKMALTEATLMEVRRFSTPFPITPPRTSNKDLVIGGYLIPAGVTVQMNLYSVLRGNEPFTYTPARI